MALTRMVQVGDKVKDSNGKVWTINKVRGNIAFFDHWLEKSKEFNCFIAQFADGTFNKNMTIVEG